MKNLSEQRGNWNEQKEKLKQRFSILTDDDLNIVRGNKDEILRRLQNKLGITKEQLQIIIKAL